MQYYQQNFNSVLHPLNIFRSFFKSYAWSDLTYCSWLGASTVGHLLVVDFCSTAVVGLATRVEIKLSLETANCYSFQFDY